MNEEELQNLKGYLHAAQLAAMGSQGEGLTEATNRAQMLESIIRQRPLFPNELRGIADIMESGLDPDGYNWMGNGEEPEPDDIGLLPLIIAGALIGFFIKLRKSENVAFINALYLAPICPGESLEVFVELLSTSSVIEHCPEHNPL